MSFRFKQFEVNDEKSTMKVGTDAVLLGVYADISHAKNILEIGTGCGVIALIMAQRSKAKITAIDIDTASCEQAKENISKTPWKERIKVMPCPLTELANSSSSKFDLIVSNPPFFENSLKPSKTSLDLAKHTTQLPHEMLVSKSKTLLSPKGKLMVILPYASKTSFTHKALLEGLFVTSELIIRPTPSKAPNRIIITLEHQKKASNREHLIIRNGDLSFSQVYKELTHDFYLNF